jgi:hypothetical protein
VSPGAIAVTAIIVSGTQVTAIIIAGAWLVHGRRILLAASPKPQLAKPGSEAQTKDKPGAVESITAARKAGAA